MVLGPEQWSVKGLWMDISPALSAITSPSSSDTSSTCCPRRSIEPDSSGLRAWSSWPVRCEPRMTRMQPCASDASESATQHVMRPSAGVSPKYVAS